MKEEAELVRNTVSGDREAYSVLVNRHLPSLTAYVLRMTSNSAEAEDIVQETFLRLWKQGSKYDPKTAKLTTWLHHIAHNLCIDFFRKNSRFVDMELSEEPEDNVNPESILTETLETRRVDQAIRLVPERQRSAIIMCHFQGLSNRDAAQILDISVDALESLLARGRRKLKQLLQNYDEN